jgi:hypothetical protein
VLQAVTFSVEISVIGLAAEEPTITAGFSERATPKPRELEVPPSTKLFQAWHSPHWPTHFALPQPHSAQVYSDLVLAAMQQNYQAGKTLALT